MAHYEQATLNHKISAREELNSILTRVWEFHRTETEINLQNHQGIVRFDLPCQPYDGFPFLVDINHLKDRRELASAIRD